MFLAAQIPELSYVHPWDVDLESRLALLTGKRRKLAYFYQAPDTSTFRYRVFNMVEALNSAPNIDISASWFCGADLDRTRRFIDEADALVICRTRYNAAVARMIARAKARRIPVFFDVDDLIFDSRYVHLIVDSLDQNTESEATWDWWFAYVTRIGATLRLCDAVITTNQYLADRVHSFQPSIPVHKVPNFLNREQYTHSARIWNAKLESGLLRDDEIEIGYFSGTPTHNRDFQIAAPALSKLLKEDSRLIVHVVGFPGSKTAMLGQPDRVKCFPLQDFINLQKSIAQVEINIAPLQNTAFSNCKSELKYFEAAVVGTVTIATPTFTFQRVISEGDNGFLARAHEWEAKLRSAIELAADKDRYAAMIESGKRIVEERYRWDLYAGCIEDAVFGTSSADCVRGAGAEPTTLSLAQQAP